MSGQIEGTRTEAGAAAAAPLPTLAINGRFFGQELSGVQRYGREAVSALDRLLGERDPGSPGKHAIFVPASVPETAWPKNLWSFRVRPVGRLSGHAWEQAELPWYARSFVLLSLTNSAPLLHPRQVVTIHDAAIKAHPSDFRWQYRAWYRGLYAVFRRSKACIVSVSEFAARDVERRFGMRPQSVAVVPNAAEHMRTIAADPEALGRLGLQPGSYVLVVGGRSGRKNFHLAEAGLHAVPAPRPILVLVDGGPQRAFSALKVKASPDRLHLREISDVTLKALYQNALCLVFPSRYEGFGLPPLEAMSCGCPVIASDAASLPEVCGDAALYCDPDRPETVSARIVQLLADPALRRRLASTGLERSKVYSWDASAKALLATALRVGSRQR